MSTKLLTLVRKCRPGPGWVLEGDTKHRVSAAARQTVLHQLADHANDDGVCRLSMYTLAAETGWSYRTVRRALESLEKDGFIEREHRYGKRGYRVADEIRLVSLRASPCVPQGQALEAPLRSVTTGTPGACQEVKISMTWEDRSKWQPPAETDPPTPKELDLREEKIVVTEERASKKPDTPVALAYEFRRTARKIQPHCEHPVNVLAVGGEFSRRMKAGISAKQVRLAFMLCCREYRRQRIVVPLGQIFLKHMDSWLEKAGDQIYEEEELPKLQKQNRVLWDRVYESLDIWLADNPGATRDQRAAMKAALYKTLSRELAHV